MGMNSGHKREKMRKERMRKSLQGSRKRYYFEALSESYKSVAEEEEAARVERGVCVSSTIS